MEFISKWAMADVFAISILLAYFASEKFNIDNLPVDTLVNMEIKNGTYFYITYALLSHMATILHIYYSK